MYGTCRDCEYCRIRGMATIQWLLKMEKVCKKRIDETPANEPVRDIINEFDDVEVVCARHPVPIVLSNMNVYCCNCGCGEYENSKTRNE